MADTPRPFRRVQLHRNVMDVGKLRTSPTIYSMIPSRVYLSRTDSLIPSTSYVLKNSLFSKNPAFAVRQGSRHISKSRVGTVLINGVLLTQHSGLCQVCWLSFLNSFPPLPVDFQQLLTHKKGLIRSHASELRFGCRLIIIRVPSGVSC